MIARLYHWFSSLLMTYSIAVMAVLHIVGIIGMLSPFQEYFRLFTPFNLLICGFLLWINHGEKSTGFYWFIALVFVLGYIVEYIGVHYGLIFGSYSYGATLGPKLLGIPLIIGINWFLIIYSVALLTNLLPVPLSLRIIAGALLAVLIDALIEPVAIRYDYWQWKDGVVPLQNYIGWFAVSLVMVSIFHLFKIKSANRLALPYYFIQLSFFLVLDIYHLIKPINL